MGNLVFLRFEEKYLTLDAGSYMKLKHLESTMLCVSLKTLTPTELL